MKYPDHIPWERQYYEPLEIPHCSKCIKCKLCATPFLDERKYIPIHINHLKEKHKITELSNYPYSNYLQRKFFINEESYTAICFLCAHEIEYNEYGLYLLNNHIEIYHGNSSRYKLIVMTEKGRDTLNKYIIKGIEATCPKCGIKIDMTHTETHPIEKVKGLLEHYFSHRYKKKVLCFTSLLTLLKRVKHDFVLLLLLYNFIIIRYQKYYD